jgi:hypothetical protein
VQKVDNKQTPREPKNLPRDEAIKKLNKGIIIIERYINKFLVFPSEMLRGSKDSPQQKK